MPGQYLCVARFDHLDRVDLPLELFCANPLFLSLADQAVYRSLFVETDECTMYLERFVTIMMTTIAAVSGILENVNEVLFQKSKRISKRTQRRQRFVSSLVYGLLRQVLSLELCLRRLNGKGETPT